MLATKEEFEMGRDYSRDEFGRRFPKKTEHIIDRLDGLVLRIQQNLVNQDNVIPNEPLIEDSLEKITEAVDLIERLRDG